MVTGIERTRKINEIWHGIRSYFSNSTVWNFFILISKHISFKRKFLLHLETCFQWLAKLLWLKIMCKFSVEMKRISIRLSSPRNKEYVWGQYAKLIASSRNFVEVRWRSLFRSTSLGKRCASYNAPPPSRKRAADRWPLRNFLPRSSIFTVGKAHKSHGDRSGLYGGCSNGVPPIHFFQVEYGIQFRSRSVWFLGFSNHEKGAPRQEISKWSRVCSTFSRSGWSVVRSASLVKGGTSKKDRHRTSTKFRLGVIRWVHELCKRPSYFRIKSNIFNKLYIQIAVKWSVENLRKSQAE
jgi:hypothetical protein